MRREVAPLRLCFLGPPAIELGKRTVRPPTKKATALLAYLALCPRGVRRESLAALFWPELGQAAAFGNLRHTLTSLRAFLPVGLLKADRETVVLGVDMIEVDVASFRAGIARCREHCSGDAAPCEDCLRSLAEAASLYRGEFLDGHNLPDCPAFDDWQRAQRDILRRELGTALERLTRGCLEVRQWDQAISHATRWISLDNLHEAAQRCLIEAYARANQKSAAIRQYEAFARLLDDELGAQPEQETTRLYNAAIEGRVVVAPVPRPVELEPLLETKISAPCVRADAVQRSRLLDRIDEAVTKPLTLVSAPPGFGKTTLLAGWVARTRHPVAWVSLDSRDNDPAYVLRAVIMALRKVHPGLADGPLGMLSSPQGAPLEAISTRLLNDVSRVSRNTVLILDDYHVLTHGSAQDLGVYLLEHLPPSLRLVIATRSDPGLPLARLRARGQLTDIRAEDLRFTPGEAADFLKNVNGLEISEAQIATLEERTEGWIAGLQLAALSMRGRHDLAAFLDGFSGSHRFVLDYLVDEVLSRQPPDVQSFLSRTSILPRLCGSLCDAVTERAGDSSAMLERLEKANLFLVPLDDHRRWYRYHRLFADLLQAKLAQTESSMIPTLHARASAWFERNGFIEEAVDQASAARDFPGMIRVIEQNLASMLNVRQTVFAGWMAALPRELLQRKPLLYVLEATSLISTMKMREAEVLVDEAETWTSPEDRSPEARDVRGRIASLRAHFASLRGDVPSTVRLGRLALDDLAPSSLIPRSTATFMLGRAYFTAGDFSNARDILLEATSDQRDTRLPFLYPVSVSLLGTLLILEGKLGEAEVLCRDANRRIEGQGVRQFFAAGNALVCLASVLRERNELEEARKCAEEGSALDGQWGEEQASYGRFVLARIYIALGDLDSAHQTLAEVAGQVQPSDPFPARSNYNKASIELALARGDPGTAIRIAHENLNASVTTHIVRHQQDELMYARALLANARAAEALKLLEPLARAAEAAGHFGRLIETLNLEAAGLQLTGNTSDAQRCVLRSLSFAAPRGFLRAFLDEGNPMRKLVESVKDSVPAAIGEHVRMILGAFGDGHS